MDLKQRILDTARGLFFRYGLKSVSMDDIAGELGVSKKTLYEVFRHKKEIINNITSDFLCRQKEHHCQILENVNDAVEELLELMKVIHHIFSSLDLRVIYDMQRYYPEAWQIYIDHKEEVIMKDIVKNLQRGINEGLFRPEINVEIIARMRLEQIQLAMDPAFFPQDKYEIFEVHRQLLLQYLHGICTQNGLIKLAKSREKIFNTK